MLSKLLKIGLPLLFLGLCLGAYVQLKKANARLRSQLAAVREHDGQTVRLRANNQRLQALVARAKIDEGDALRAIHDETEQARAEVADLEQRAEERRAAKLAKDRAANAALLANRDPTKGPMLIENCGNVGRGTPADALQTLLWASAKGHDELVENLISVSGAARLVCDAMIATLPESERKKYPTPEKLMSLMIADIVTDVTAFEVAGQTMEDAQHATLTVARLSGKSQDVPMEFGPNGWQVAIADKKFLRQFQTRVLGPSPAPAETKK